MVVNWKKNVKEKNLKERRGRGRERERGDRSLNFTGKSLGQNILCGVSISTSCTRTVVVLNLKKLKNN